jgi:type I restriction enzyme, S subunit
MELNREFEQTGLRSLPSDWTLKPLGEIGEALIGLTYAPSDVAHDGILVLRSSNVHDGSLRFEDNVFVRRTVPEKIMVREGDILICVRNGSRSLIGKAALIDEQAKGMTFGAFMAVFRTSFARFVYHQITSDLVKRQIHGHLGATINQITNKSLNSFRVPFPQNEHERESIAAALSDMDALLGALDRLIAKKRDLKQAATQQLLTGQTRLPGFSGKWETKRLADIGRFIKGRGIKKEEARSGDLPCVRYGEIYTLHNDVVRRFNSWISRDVAATATRLHAGDVLFAGSGETKEEIGKAVVFVDQVEAYAGGDIVILRPTGCDHVFLGYLLNTAPVVAQKASYGQGDAVVHISASALGRVQVKLPESAEQSAIATILTDMDAALTALEQRRDKTRLLKHGMMQELLTGRTRLV